MPLTPPPRRTQLWPYPVEVLCNITTHLPISDLKAAANTNSLFRAIARHELVKRTPAYWPSEGSDNSETSLARVLQVNRHQRPSSCPGLCATPLATACFPRVEALRFCYALTTAGSHWNSLAYNDAHTPEATDNNRALATLEGPAPCGLTSELAPQTLVLRRLSIYSSGFCTPPPPFVKPPSRIVWVFEPSNQGYGIQRINDSFDSYVQTARGARSLTILFLQTKGASWVTDRQGDDDKEGDYGHDPDRTWDMVMGGVKELFSKTIPLLLLQGSESSGSVLPVTVVNVAPLEHTTSSLSAASLGHIAPDPSAGRVQKHLVSVLKKRLEDATLPSFDWSEGGRYKAPSAVVPQHSPEQLAKGVRFVSMEEYLAVEDWRLAVDEHEVAAWRREHHDHCS